MFEFICFCPLFVFALYLFLHYYTRNGHCCFVFYFYAIYLSIDFCLHSVVSVTIYFVVSDMTYARNRWNSRKHRKIAAILNVACLSEAPNTIRKMPVTDESLLTSVKPLYVTQDSSTVVVYNFTRFLWFMVYRTGNITFVAWLLWFMAYRTRNITVGACLFRFIAYVAYITTN